MAIKIGIDAGHGSQTAGKRTPSGFREHWGNVKCASYFAKAMDRCGIEYIKVGWNDDNAKDDVDVALATRQKQIKNAGCDYSVSWHLNAFGDGKSYNSAQGIETLISDKSPGDSLRLANCVQNQLIKGTKQVSRGVKTQALAMCNCGVMGTKASILIECGFMTNSYEANLMQSDAFCKECAEEAARGFCEYVGIKYVAEGSVAPAPTTSPTPQPSSTVPVKVNADVKSIQVWLNKYYATGLVTDGIYGANTRKALVKAWQKEVGGLTADGIFGAKSLAAAKNHQLSKGSRGIIVTIWQAALVCNKYNPNGVDGIFGSGCVNTTLAYKTAKGLPKDSTVTPETWKKIFFVGRCKL